MASVLVIALAVVIAVIGLTHAQRAATTDDWIAAAVLGGTALLATLGARIVSPRRDNYAPPWDADTVWLFPAAMLTPPVVFVPLIALSVLFTVTRHGNAPSGSIPSAAITVITTFAVHFVAVAVSGLFLAGLLGIAVVMLVGAAAAGPTATVIGTPGASLLWHDLRWALVQSAACLCGLLVTAAMVTDVRFGVVAAAPLLLVAFALRWPELDRTARTDAKTGLPNWEHWRERSQAVLAGAALHQQPGAVLIIDLDLFKNVNDEHGHLIGDQVLTTVAGALRAQVRATDVLGRFGGEEFVVTATEITPDGAFELAERIRTAVAAITHHGAQTGDSAVSFAVTCTVGLAVTETYGYRLTALLDHADAALMEGKAAGRNRSVAAAGAPDSAVSGARRRLGSRVRRWQAVALPQARRSGRV